MQGEALSKRVLLLSNEVTITYIWRRLNFRTDQIGIRGIIIQTKTLYIWDTWFSCICASLYARCPS